MFRPEVDLDLDPPTLDNFQSIVGARALAAQSTAEFDLMLTAELSAPVPIPGAIWLLGSTLIGLAGLKRKFSKE